MTKSSKLQQSFWWEVIKDMERHGSLWFLMGILLLLQHAAAQNKTHIPHHVNLSPFWGWRSAEECLITYQKTSAGYCKGTAVLTHVGVIEVVNKSDLIDFCQIGGCIDHTRDVLDCIHHVKRDYRFYNNLNIFQVNHTITDGCNHLSGINTNYTSSNAMKLLASCSSWNILFLSMLAFIILIVKDMQLMI